MNESEFEEIIQFHEHRYPQMQPLDYGKLAYQSEFGPEHLVTDKEAVLFYLRKEWKEIEEADKPCWSETIGNGLCRFHLGKVDDIEKSSSLLADLFILTSKEHKGTQEGLISKLQQIQKRSIPGFDSFLNEYKASNYPAVHHSQTFRDNYHPHYRLLRDEYAFFFSVLNTIQEKLSKVDKKPLMISIDGRCGSGKTFLAEIIHRVFPCNIFHTDDYYMPLNKRQENWEKIPGGNMNFERLKENVILPSINGSKVIYQPFDCKTDSLKNAVTVEPSNIVIIEGSYSNHPSLGENYDFKIFLTCQKEMQENRLKKREGGYFSAFEKRWIPMEENYFKTFDVQKKCDVVLDTSQSKS